MEANAAEKELLARLKAAQTKADEVWKVAFEEEQKGREVDPKEYAVLLSSVVIPEQDPREESDPTDSNI